VLVRRLRERYAASSVSQRQYSLSQPASLEMWCFPFPTNASTHVRKLSFLRALYSAPTRSALS
jgi:hypothetical protein